MRPSLRVHPHSREGRCRIKDFYGLVWFFFFSSQENKLGSSLLVAKITEEKAVSCKSVNEIL